MRLIVVFHALAAGFHLLLDCCYCVLVLGLIEDIPLVYENMDCWGFEYLTVITQILQQLYIYLSLYQELWSNSLSKTLNQMVTTVRNFLFPTIIAELNVVVLVMFWFHYMLDPQLIEKFGVMEKVESWLNHCLHTIPVLITMTEVVIGTPKFPNRRFAFISMVGIVAAYTTVIFICHSVGGHWAYPLVELVASNWVYMTLYIIASVLIGFVGFCLVEAISSK